MKTQSIDFKKERLAEAKTHAESKNGKCLSTIYVTAISPLRWYCNKHNHEWEAGYNSIFSRGSWCPVCSLENRAKKHEPQIIEICHNLAKNNDGKCLTDTFTHHKTKMLWKCANENHPPFLATYKNIRHKKSWCPLCAKKGSNIPTEDRASKLEKLVNSKRGQVLETFKNKYFSAKLKCKNKDHQPWIARVDSILKDGTWCKACSISGDLTENRIRLFFEKFYKCHFPNVRPSWNKGENKINPYLLKSEKTLAKPTKERVKTYLELDGYSEQCKLAFEYDGAYHYLLNPRYTTHSTRIKKFSIIKQNDFTKEINCNDRGIKLIRFPAIQRNTYNHFFPLLRYVVEHCREHNIYMKFKLSELRELKASFYS